MEIRTGEVKRHSVEAAAVPRTKKLLTPHSSLLTIIKPLLVFINFLLIFMLLLSGCTFDYGNTAAEDSGQPDIIMNDVEYVRVRDGDPVVRFQAQRAERYEKRQTMELRDFSFEQFGNHGEDINAAGRAGTASVELDSGNIRLGGGISIAVDSEDITIETERLDWQDKERILSGEAEGEVHILRENGTSFTGRGFTANVRSRTWEFSDGVDGTYIHDDEEEEPGGETVDEAAEAAEAVEGETPADEDNGTMADPAGVEPGL
jgi:LPS export ABC transporter protein LptC